MTNTALIVVDMQNDFITGSLATDPDQLKVRRIAHWIRHNARNYDTVVTTQDWHIDPGEHFSDNPDFKTSWPVHCVAGEHGADMYTAVGAALGASKLDAKFLKGMYHDAYSGFEGFNSENQELGLNEYLREREVEQVDIIGIATDHCVQATALDAADFGYRTRVLRDNVIGVDPDACDKTLEETLPAAGVKVV